MGNGVLEEEEDDYVVNHESTNICIYAWKYFWQSFL